MLGGLRLVSVQRGHDPREFTLFAFGGAGPLHANALMELLGSPVAVVPPAPGRVLARFGLPRRRRAARVRAAAISAGSSRLSRDELLDARGRPAARRGRPGSRARGFAADDRGLSFQFGMRYSRQGYELPVLHADPRADPDAAHDAGASRSSRRTGAPTSSSCSSSPSSSSCAASPPGASRCRACRPRGCRRRGLAEGAITDAEHRDLLGRRVGRRPVYRRDRRCGPATSSPGRRSSSRRTRRRSCTRGRGRGSTSYSNLLLERCR